MIYEQLLAIRELVAAGDCKRAAARNEAGAPCALLARDAVTFCTSGAIQRTVGYSGTIYDLLREAQATQGSGVPFTEGIPYIHDHSTHLQNVERIERAALLAKARGL